MKTFSAKEAQQTFPKILESVIVEPVAIRHYGKEVAVILSVEQYHRFQELEDAYWIQKAEQSRKQGSLGVEKSKEFLEEMLNA